MKILNSAWNMLRVCFAPAPLLTEEEQLELIKKGSTSVLYLAIGRQKFSEKAEDLLITYVPSYSERKHYVTLASDYYILYGFSNRQKLLALENAPCVGEVLVAQILQEFVSAWGSDTTQEENQNRVIFLLKCGDDEIIEAFQNLSEMVEYCKHVEVVMQFWQHMQSKGAYDLGIAEMNEVKVEQNLKALMPNDEIMWKLSQLEDGSYFKIVNNRLAEVNKWFNKQFIA